MSVLPFSEKNIYSTPPGGIQEFIDKCTVHADVMSL